MAKDSHKYIKEIKTKQFVTDNLEHFINNISYLLRVNKAKERYKNELTGWNSLYYKGEFLNFVDIDPEAIYADILADKPDIQKHAFETYSVPEYFNDSTHTLETFVKGLDFKNRKEGSNYLVRSLIIVLHVDQARQGAHIHRLFHYQVPLLSVLKEDVSL